MGCKHIKTCVLATSQEDCMHWREFPVSDRNYPDAKRLREDCVFGWVAIFMYDLAFKMAGNQSAVESMRNMLAEAKNGRKQVQIPVSKDILQDKRS